MPAKTTCFNVPVHTSCTSLLISLYLLQMYVKLYPSDMSDMLPFMHKRAHSFTSPLSVFILDLLNLRKRMCN